VQMLVPFTSSKISSKSAQTGDLRLPPLDLVPAIDGVELLVLEPVLVAIDPSPPPPSRSTPNKATVSTKPGR
jgi:hypothetical protein